MATECNECNDPNWDPDAYLRTIRDHIDGYGVHLVGVTGETGGWTYTIGLAELGLPELVVTDVPMSCAGQILNTIARNSASEAELRGQVEEMSLSLRSVNPALIQNSDLVAGWFNFYWSQSETVDPPALDVLQVVLKQGDFCVGPVSQQTNLGQPDVPMLRPPTDILADLADHRRRRHLNRAERRGRHQRQR